jgi:hypothetical protein
MQIERRIEMERRMVKLNLTTESHCRFQEKSSGSPVIGTLYIEKPMFDFKELIKVKIEVELG